MKDTRVAMHLIIDGYGSNAELLWDEEFIYQLLDKYPAEIGMNKIAPPHFIRYIGNKPEDRGISGIVLIAESHIGIHTWVERRFVNIDIFSCKSFDARRTVEEFKTRLQLTELRFCLLERSSGKLGLLAEGEEATAIKL